MTTETYLPNGLPAPVPENDGLDTPFWEAAARHELVVQRCNSCQNFQWGPEWICHKCHSFDIGWTPIEGRGVLYSYERIWHPVHPALGSACPYLVILVELPGAGSIRMLGNLLGDPEQEVVIGSEVEAVFEDHEDGKFQYTLVQWRTVQ